MIVQKCANAIIEHGINNASIVNVASIVGKYGNIGQAMLPVRQVLND